MYLSLVGIKEAANRIGFVNGSSEGAGVRMLKRAASEIENQPALELSKTPALIDLCAGRITVDAREKD